MKRLLALFLFASVSFAAPIIKVMPIGNSITLGNWTGGWRPQLMKMLHDSTYVDWKYAGRLTTLHEDTDGLGFDFPDSMWGHEGYSDYTATQIANLAGAAIVANTAEVYVLEAGINDITSGIYTASQVRDHIKASCDTIFSRKPTAKIVLANIMRTFPGLVSDTATVNTIVRATNALLPAMVSTYTTAGKYIVLVDQYAKLTLSSDFEDGVHPSNFLAPGGGGYVKMAQAYYPAVRNAITTRWVTAYYPNWWYFANPPSKIPWTKLTHIIIFGNSSPNPGGTSRWSTTDNAADSANFVNGNDTGIPSNYLQRSVDSAHAHGVKVLIGLGIAGDGSRFTTVCGTEADCQTMVNSIYAFAQRWNMDGVDIDWEWPTSAADGAGVNRLIRKLRQKSASWTIALSGNYMKNLGPDCANTPFYFNKDSINTYVDQFNLQTYNMWIGLDCVPYTTGFDTPITKPTYSGYTGIGLNSDSALSSWDRAGFKRSKIGIGMNYAPSRFQAPGMGAVYSSWGFTTVDGSGSSYPVMPLRSTGTWVWHDVAKCYYAITGGYVYSLIDTTSMAYLAQYARDNGYGGAMIYDIPSGTYRSQSNLATANQLTYRIYDVLNGAAPIAPTLISIPAVTTTAISQIAGTTATSGGNVTSDGGATVTARGVCWATSVNPTTANSFTTNSAGTGSYASSMTGLSLGTLYHVRAYATNSTGTAYGADVTFTTIALATFSSASVTSIAQTTATGSANNNSAGGGSVTERGWVVGSSSSPAIGGSGVTKYISNNPTGTGAYSTSITGLTASTAYNGRAYAINQAGTAYSSNVTFNTIGAPIVGAVVVSLITKTGAVFTVSINNNGTTGTTQDSFLVGTTSGTYTTRVVGSPATSTGTTNTTVTYTISGLTSTCSTLGSTYYVRGQGTNTIGTTQGVEVSFTTLPAMSMYSQPELDSAKAFAYNEGVVFGKDIASLPTTQTVTLKNKGGQSFQVDISPKP